MTIAHNGRIPIRTQGEGHMVDITALTQDILTESGLREGHCCVFTPGATAAVTTIEFEPGLQRDFPDAMNRIAPRDVHYYHEEAWHDGNGHSHIRASLLGPSIVIPFIEGHLTLGTWQQIVVIDFDNRPRSREIIVQLLGVK